MHGASEQDIERRTRALKRVARSLVGGDEHGADDVVQAAWLAALEAPPRVLSMAWLRRVVASRAGDERRRRAVRAADEVGDDVHAPDGDAAEAAQQLELSARLAAALASLREPYRTVLYLRYFEDLAPPQIATRLCEPLATVKTRLRRGLALLREELGVDGGDANERGRTYSGLVALAGLPRETPALAPLLSLSLAIGMKKIVAVAFVLVAALAAVWFVFEEPAASPRELERVEGRELAVELAGTRDADVAAPMEAAARESLVVESAPSVAAPLATGEIAVHVTWHDGTPAPNIDVALDVSGERVSRGSATSLVTDASGAALFQELAPDEWFVRTDRGASQIVAVGAGERVRVDIALERGVDVSGRVTDESGSPLAGAAIRIATRRGDWATSRTAAHTDANGAFFVRALAAERSLSAFADGFAPSADVDLEQRECADARTTVDFVLVRGGARFVGRVVDTDGRPVPGAIVALGDPAPYIDMRRDGSEVDDMGPRVERTDSNGQFVFTGLAPGRTPLTVRADGFAVLRAEIEFATEGSTERELVLFRGATVSGVVRDAAGRPFAGAHVCAFDAPLPTTFIGTGQIDFARVFGYVHATSAADGRFELAHLPHGEVYLYAFERLNIQAIGSVMRAQHVLALTDGESATWDPSIERGHTIVGVVEYADGSPVAQTFVTAIDESSGQRAVLVAGEDGRFEFLNLEPHTFTVTVQVFGAPQGSTPPKRQGVSVDGEELVLRLDHSPAVEAARGSVSGRFVDSSERATPGAALTATLHSTQWFRTDAEWTVGAFTFGDVAAGSYHVVVWSGDNPIARSAAFTVASGEQVDVGTITSEPGGALELVLTRAPDAASAAAELHLALGDGLFHEPIAIAAGQERVRLERLAPGPLSGTLVGDDLVTRRFELEIVAFETATATAHLARGALCTFEVALTTGAVSGDLVLVVRDASGAVAHEAKRALAAVLVSPVSFEARLPLGTYTYAVTGSGSGAVEGTFTLEALEPLTVVCSGG
jgi:RNA polymerase sigma-70 factor (ECF subfamily)